MSKLETFFYNLYCIITLGGAWLFKVIMKKAMVEAGAVNRQTTIINNPVDR